MTAQRELTRKGCATVACLQVIDSVGLGNIGRQLKVDECRLI